MTRDQRTLGAYYSPEPYARALVRWALNSTPQKLMDPSFGGCAFLRVALEELRTLGSHLPEQLIYGTDIDGETAQWASHLVSAGVPATNLLATDFLALSPGRDLPRVGALVGNPPYVRHHRLTPGAMSSAVSATGKAGIALNGRANLWAYFVVHASEFITKGGRMALLLPGSILHADYAEPVLRHLADRFGDVLLVRIGERVFEDAQEETVVLLASRAGEGKATVKTMECPGLSDLSTVLTLQTSANDRVTDYKSDWKHSVLDADCRDLLEDLPGRSKDLASLGSIADVRIGTVTGANEFFVMTNDEVHRIGLDEHAINVIPRSAWLTTAAFDATQMAQKRDAGLKMRMLKLPSDLELPRFPGLEDRIRTAEDQEIHLRPKCSRDPWWALGTVSIPDAFLPYMGSSYRGLVRNAGNFGSTNAIHQVTWREGTGNHARSAAISSSWSSLTALSAELYGRNYGGGVLKVEPSAAKRLLVLTTRSRRRSTGSGLNDREKADTEMANTLSLSKVEQEVIVRNVRKLSQRRSLKPEIPSVSKIALSARSTLDK